MFVFMIFLHCIYSNNNNNNSFIEQPSLSLSFIITLIGRQSYIKYKKDQVNLTFVNVGTQLRLYTVSKIVIFIEFINKFTSTVIRFKLKNKFGTPSSFFLFSYLWLAFALIMFISWVVRNKFNHIRTKNLGQNLIYSIESWPSLFNLVIASFHSP